MSLRVLTGDWRAVAGRALAEMHPLCTLRYSATHIDKHHMVYRLDAVDAYEQKLVKQIEVASATVEDAHNTPYVRLISTASKGSVITAKVEVDVAALSGVRRMVKVVQDGDDLEQTTGRPIYQDCRIGEIRVEPGNKFVELRVPGGEHYLKPGEAWGDVDDLAIKHQMIRRAIKEHLDKEKRLRPQGIKVLTLFFVDRVDKYRQYDQGGPPQEGRIRPTLRGRIRALVPAPRLQDSIRGGRLQPLGGRRA